MVIGLVGAGIGMVTVLIVVVLLIVADRHDGDAAGGGDPLPPAASESPAAERESPEHDSPEHESPGAGGEVEVVTDPPEFGFEELADHPLLDENIGLPNVECSFATPVDTRSELEAHAGDAIDCLDRMWEPVLRAAGLHHSSPQLFVPVSMTELESPCADGGPDHLAFYCPTDQGIYLPLDAIGLPPEVMPHYYVWVVAHEYGHHVQYLSGIGQASDVEERERRTYTPGAREVLRRLELQAECFAGMFLGSSDSAGNLDMATHYDSFMEWTTNGGPSDSHGSGLAQASWWSSGYLSNRTASCNTFSAGLEDVAAE